ncbi:MAG: YARHG domain-containing protein [Coriobacteriales bacterium]|nr:YARHG domain-containing protein [Coriobacteriales bacterium]
MISKNSLGVDKELAEGSFGSVYSITNPHCISGAGQEYVYKEYKEYVSPDEDSLAAFAKFYHGLSTGDKSYLDSICCWPHELVKDGSNDGVSGFLMIQIPERFYCPISFSTGTKVVEAKFEHLLIPDRLLTRRQIPLTDKARYKLLLSVVRGLNFFHEHGVCVGDFSHSNVLFSLSGCSVFFLDCDSFSLGSKTVFPQTETGNWGVAERYPGEEPGTEKSDIYKLGLLALRLLMQSDNPSHYQASTNIERLPSQMDAEVKTVIENSLKDAPDRPALATWSAALRAAIMNCVSEPVAERAVGYPNKTMASHPAPVMTAMPGQLHQVAVPPINGSGYAPLPNTMGTAVQPSHKAKIGWPAKAGMALAAVMVIALGIFVGNNAVDAFSGSGGSRDASVSNSRGSTPSSSTSSSSPSSSSSSTGTSSNSATPEDRRQNTTSPPETTEPDEVKPATANSDYMISNSNQRYVTEAEIRKLSAWERYIARNEIFARHGRGFKNQDLRDYFRTKNWYTERYSPEEFDALPSPLNAYEKENADLILSIETADGSPYI